MPHLPPPTPIGHITLGETVPVSRQQFMGRGAAGSHQQETLRLVVRVPPRVWLTYHGIYYRGFEGASGADCYLGM